MDIEIIVVGKLKERYLQEGVNEYLKRLKSYADISVIELKDQSTDVRSEREEEIVLEKEADEIEKHLKSEYELIVTAIEGKLISSEDLAEVISENKDFGPGKIQIVIGGSLGIHPRIKAKAKRKISFGRITLPHQLMRLVLVEQVYRAFRIINNHPYHK